jgi:hypothetical protein
MRKHWILAAALIAPLLVSSLGCITTAVVLGGAALLGEDVKDDDVKTQRDNLIGKKLSDADKRFGERFDTFVDTKNRSRELAVYRVRGSVNSFYIVEAHSDKIVAIDKKRENQAAVKRVLKNENLEAELMGKSPAECEKAVKLGAPVLIVQSRKTGDIVRVYDAKKTEVSSVSYITLRFDKNNACTKINLIGLMSSTKQGGTIKG